MFNKRDLCEEIGNFFGTFYEDISGFLVIDDGRDVYTYKTEDELLKDWFYVLMGYNDTAGDDYWTDVIEYIQNYVIDY